MSRNHNTNHIARAIRDRLYRMQPLRNILWHNCNRRKCSCGRQTVDDAPTLQQIPPRHMHQSAAVMAVIFGVALVCATHLQAEPVIDELRAANLEKAANWFETQQARASTNEHLQILPRIVVDTQEPAVIFKAEATGLAANEIVEFFLIGEESGNAYEAIAVAFAEPADIVRAIDALGLPRGRYADPRALRFWPQGERVHLFLNEHHAADLMLDQRTGNTANRDGFVFTASRKVERDGEKHLAVQVEPPFSIASNYNEPNTILDVPFRAPQAEVYTKQVQNPAIRFAPGEMLTVRIVPERTDGTLRVQESALIVTTTETASRIPLTDLRFTRRHATDASKIYLDNATPQAFLAHMREIVAAKQDPFVLLSVDHGLTLAHAHIMAQLIETMEDNEGLRVLPPPAGELFYRAFLPDENRREREDRFAQPWELHLSQDASPVLVNIQEEWQQGEMRPDITVEKITIEEPETLSDKMRELRPDMNAVFIYAPRTMRVGEMMNIVQHFHATHPFIHIFMTPPPRARTSDAAPATTSE